MPATRIGNRDVLPRNIINKIMMLRSAFFKLRLPNNKLRRYPFIGRGRTVDRILCQELSDDHDAE